MGTILTVGHGTLDAADLARLLVVAEVDEVVDVRRHPGSRRHPQHSSEALAEWLPASGIAYRWIEALGGRRQPDPASVHVGLRNEQFRAYADHMASEEFLGGLAEVLDDAARGRVAIMCSESVWWRCHRRLVADHLVMVGDVAVEHLFHDGRLQAHPTTPEARVVDGAVVYDVGSQGTLLDA